MLSKCILSTILLTSLIFSSSAQASNLDEVEKELSLMQNEMKAEVIALATVTTAAGASIYAVNNGSKKGTMKIHQSIYDAYNAAKKYNKLLDQQILFQKFMVIDVEEVNSQIMKLQFQNDEALSHHSSLTSNRNITALNSSFYSTVELESERLELLKKTSQGEDLFQVNKKIENLKELSKSARNGLVLVDANLIDKMNPSQMAEYRLKALRTSINHLERLKSGAEFIRLEVDNGKKPGSAKKLLNLSKPLTYLEKAENDLREQKVVLNKRLESIGLKRVSRSWAQKGGKIINATGAFLIGAEAYRFYGLMQELEQKEKKVELAHVELIENTID